MDKKIAYTLNGRMDFTTRRSLKQVALELGADLDSRSDRLLKGGRGTL